MSNRGAHVQDTSVIERRLRPIYDWLDGGSYKKAIQECDKVLKKSSNLHRVKALKALALLRLGKDGECTAILDALIATKPIDDGTLQAMSMCYREMQQLDQVCKLYEEAVKGDPTNEELHTHLFMAHVRMSNYKSQQQAAMTLYKLQSKKPYYCWAIMSIILQAQRGDGVKDEQKRNVLLSLAERMIDKMIQDNKMEAEPVVLYIMILEALHKYAKIVDVLDGPLGEKLAGEMVHNKLPYLIKLGQWTMVNVMCKKMLQESMDRWDIWKYYLNSVFEMKTISHENATNRTENKDNKDDEIPDDTPEKAHEFICKLMENASGNGFSLRGPYLARFELAKQLHQLNRTQTHQSHQSLLNLLGDVEELFVEYFRKFGHKPCSVSDLRDYLNLLAPERRLQLASRLVKEVGISATSVPQSEQQMQRHICALQLSRLCGSHRELQYEHAMALVTAFAFHYLHGYQTYSRDVLSTEQGPADPYILLAAHLLYDLHVKSESTRPLILALVLLNNTLRNSPSNFHIKLLMLRIYHVLGCCLEAQNIYESLDIKHLQLDSMCHIHCAHLSTTGHYALANGLFDATLKFFSTNYKDSSEHLTFSYKFGSFLKLTEFMDFRERMNNSFHYTSVAVDKMFLTLEQCATVDGIFALDTIPRDHPVMWDLIRNNSDLSVYLSWDPERIDTSLEEWPQNQSIYEQDVDLLKMRVSILYCINSTLQLLKVGDNKDAAEKMHLEEEIRRLDGLQKDIEKKNYQTVKQNTISINHPSRLEIYQKTSYHKIVVAAFKIIPIIETGEVDASLQTIETAKDCFDALGAFILELLQGSNGKCDPYLHNRKDIQFLCNFVEITSILVFVLLVSVDLTRISQAPSKKKKQPDGKLRESVLNLVTTVKDHVKRVDKSLEEFFKRKSKTAPSLNDEHIIKDVIDKLATLNITNTDEEHIVEALARSNEVAVKEIRAVLKSKLKLLNVSS